MVSKIVKDIDVFFRASFLVHSHKILAQKIFLYFSFPVTKMESTECKKSAVLPKKVEIKAIIHEFREFIEVWV